MTICIAGERDIKGALYIQVDLSGRGGGEGRVQIKVKGVAQAMLGMDGDISSGKYAGEKGRGGMF